MELFKTIPELQDFLKRTRKQGKSIGFVPTMGALHQGHISLIKESISENSLTVASIFVNPLQFNNTKDLQLYPRPLEKDLEMLREAGCDVAFIPSEDNIYKEKPIIKLNFGILEETMEGKFRPGHFNGMAIIVSKLFHYVLPDKAYFGQKDLQQFAIIRQIVKDFSFPIDLKCCPIIREEDGLAMSSRNVRLSPQKRPVAAQLYESLVLAKDSINLGSEAAREKAISHLQSYPDISLEYLEIVNAETLQPVKDVKNSTEVAICIAANIDGVRLIDNIILS